MGDTHGLYNTGILNENTLDTNIDKLQTLLTEFEVIDILTFIPSGTYLSAAEIATKISKNKGGKRTSQKQILIVEGSLDVLHKSGFVVKERYGEQYKLDILKIKVVEEVIDKLTKLKIK